MSSSAGAPALVPHLVSPLPAEADIDFLRSFSWLQILPDRLALQHARWGRGAGSQRHLASPVLDIQPDSMQPPTLTSLCYLLRSTPWVIVGGHRPLYISSNYDAGPASDLVVARALRAAYEQAFAQYKVIRRRIALRFWLRLHAALPQRTLVSVAGWRNIRHRDIFYPIRKWA